MIRRLLRWLLDVAWFAALLGLVIAGLTGDTALAVVLGALLLCVTVQDVGRQIVLEVRRLGLPYVVGRRLR